MLIYQNTEIETDSEGYLKDTTLWSEGLAEAIAAVMWGCFHIGPVARSHRPAPALP